MNPLPRTPFVWMNREGLISSCVHPVKVKTRHVRGYFDCIRLKTSWNSRSLNALCFRRSLGWPSHFPQRVQGPVCAIPEHLRGYGAIIRRVTRAIWRSWVSVVNESFEHFCAFCAFCATGGIAVQRVGCAFCTAICTAKVRPDMIKPKRLMTRLCRRQSNYWKPSG